ncbi:MULTISPECIES: sigma-70 family RNA polymerase sigma factor [unclassified Nodularia (in: cyanobacteria)]|uniref:sigma-70 family RNA polymerase sigma factor n=1 Tax=unclassified Nodularia (in: cyanobacteria) TaxID=2656917 RepID=UPI00187F61EB|nr:MULTISPECIES: sigma-70 family RNA polymerase sigma factor [unclassified Nodularia (in: cyanobacteria)]MBE9199439.1 sigma-70 family RNA polymerase sigma factor [Nodularia sp. LEGE 06071]MCC2692937.1 sigma-70 family RNA polymerase sigma factor [Nodularia sp. LEGE 04288]
MQPRQSITEIFSTFVQLDADRFNVWATDSKLQRSIKRCLEQYPQQQSDNFWVLYWYKIWQIESNPIAVGHISAYLQEVCYWVSRKIAVNFISQFSIADCFQMAISCIYKILKNFNPEYSTNLKSYAEYAFERFLKDSLRLGKEADICTDWALLHKISRKRLGNSLTNAGFNSQIINNYVLAWECFKELYTSDSQTIRQLGKPDTATWQAMTQLYNRQSLSQLTPETLEKWLSTSAKAVRDFLYPKFVSVDAPIQGQDSGNLLDTLPAELPPSLLTEIIAQEESTTRETQQAQLNQVLMDALAALDIQAQKLLQAYYQQQLTQQQISEQLEIKQYTVSRRLSSIKRSLLTTLTQWSQNHLHISPTPVVVDAISKSLEEWLKNYYSHTHPPLK